MPYSSNQELPSGVKDNLPEKAQTIWRKIANSALKQYPDDESKAFATAWSGLRGAGWTKSGDSWIEKDLTTSDVHIDKPLGEEKKFNFNIQKFNTDKKIVFGWCMISRDKFGNTVYDLQDDCIDPQDLEDLAYKYVQFYGDSGEMHSDNGGKAKIIESVVTTLEKQNCWGIPSGVLPIGWWVGFQILDDSVWQKIKDGTYKAFSIEGEANREVI